jgi:membrane protease YdiL (CAAX protease family)
MIKSSLSNKNAIWILVTYFIGYMVIFPLLTELVTEVVMYLTGYDMLMFFSSLMYVFVFAIIVYLARKPLLDYFYFFKNSPFSTLKIGFIKFLQMFGIFIFINLALFMLLGREAANEEIITQQLLEYPLFIILLSCVFAPIVEEIVFREVIFNKLAGRYNFIFGLILSSFLFGFVHVMDAVFLGSFDEMIYIISYGGLGVMLALGYRYKNNGSINILMHFFNNLISIILTLVVVGG